jgi:nifR3 family TIM-barrel protein
MNAPPLTDPFTIAGLEVPNRVVLAPLAGIGNWFVRLQAKRYGAGLTISEMISSFAIHHRNEKTMRDLLMIHDSEREYPGPIAFQLFGQDPEVMRSAAATAAEQGADIIDLNMGCPVPKVMKNGAGAALISDPAVAVEIARAAAEGSGLPVTVKLRSGQKKGEADGFQLALRLVDEAGVAAIAFHPRSAQVHHKGSPDYELAAKLVDQLPVPVILSGGMSDHDATLAAREQTGAAAVMLARGGLGNPWLFEHLLGLRDEAPTQTEILAELEWIIDRAVEHLGDERAARYLRTFYPWYLDQLELDKATLVAFQQSESIGKVREMLAELGPLTAAAGH